MKDLKNKKKHVITQRNNSKQLPPPLREVTQKGGGYNPSTRKAAFTLAGGRRPLSNSGYRRAAFTLAEGGRRPLLNSGYRRAAFTLAEVLITLAVIGIVAVLTIPALVKNHQERTWSTAQDVFTKKFEVAMKTMANDSTVSGYDSTESFVNELKKYIKITNVCTDDVTKCFAPKVIWTPNEEAIEVTNKAVKYNESTGDWAETVGVQFANGVNALISYNKQCYVDPYNNQEAITAKCVGMIYDVSGFKTPNTKGKDILANANVTALAGDVGCVYKLSDGTCFTKILSAHNGGYSPLTKEQCEAQKDKLGISECGVENDYWAGAVAVCGHKGKLLSPTQLTALAKEIYNTEAINANGWTGNVTLDTEKAAPFLEQSCCFPSFFIWDNQEYDANDAFSRAFSSTGTDYGTEHTSRINGGLLAVCVSSDK